MQLTTAVDVRILHNQLNTSYQAYSYKEKPKCLDNQCPYTSGVTGYLHISTVRTILLQNVSKWPLDLAIDNLKRALCLPIKTSQLRPSYN